MEYVVMDLEWNQPTVRGKRVRNLHGEIMQIGAVKVDEKMNVIDTFDQMIKPNFYHKVNHDIHELTGISTEDIQNGTPFIETMDMFKEWCGNEFKFITWSGTDVCILKNNLEIYSEDTEWIPDTYDAQLMFDDQFTQEDRAFALNYALYYFKEKPAGLHNGLADAMSTVKVLTHLDTEEGLQDEYFLC